MFFILKFTLFIPNRTSTLELGIKYENLWEYSLHVMVWRGPNLHYRIFITDTGGTGSITFDLFGHKHIFIVTKNNAETSPAIRLQSKPSTIKRDVEHKINVSTHKKKKNVLVIFCFIFLNTR